MRRFTIFAATVLGAAVLAGTALAEPEVFADAKSGDLDVSASILLSAKATDMRGGWLNESLGCNQWRRIKVSIIVERIPTSGRPKVIRKSKSRATMNCGEGGPNMGFSLSARGLGLACPNGAWKPGRYAFATTVEHLATGVTAIASLGWRKRGSC